MSSGPGWLRRRMAWSLSASAAGTGAVGTGRVPLVRFPRRAPPSGPAMRPAGGQSGADALRALLCAEVDLEG
jgi:hypothetical protein